MSISSPIVATVANNHAARRCLMADAFSSAKNQLVQNCRHRRGISSSSDIAKRLRTLQGAPPEDQ
jgi:hypothetical protein